jgi:hypothetical protein
MLKAEISGVFAKPELDLYVLYKVSQTFMRYRNRWMLKIGQLHQQ